VPSNGAWVSATSPKTLLSYHGRRQRNDGEADWLLRAQGLAVAYNWPDGDDTATALVISVWRE
jgi:hypothetical protein